MLRCELILSGILSAIREKMAGLHRKEQGLADYIVKHPQRVVHMGIAELAEQSLTSTATISRFCKAFYFKGFTDFKMKLTAELAQSPTVQSYQDIIAGNPMESIIAAIEVNHLRSITDTTRLLDMKQLHHALDALGFANQIDIYGVATSGIGFLSKACSNRKRAAVFSDPHMQVTSASNLTERDVAFAVSYSGETPETIDALRCAKENSALTVSLSKFSNSTLSSLSDIQLFTTSLEEGMRRGDTVTCRQ